MDIKDLNKSQLILLAILLSFITSIATAIMAVSLLQQEPVSITTPINRVIQQTVEKIVQVPGNDVVQTVVVKEEDLVVDAVAKNKTAVFSITKDFEDLTGVNSEISVGQGFAINTGGVIAADAVWVSSKEKYYVKNDSGKFKAEYLFSDKGVSFLKIGESLDGTSAPKYIVPTVGDISKMKVGQKILVLGITISSFIFDGGQDVKINVNKSTAGGLVLNLDGEALGIALSGESVSFVPLGLINDSFKANQPQ